MNPSFSIEALSTQGEGIARCEGKVCFLPFTLPSETWTGQIIEQKKNYNRALPLQCLSDSMATPPERREPLCAHFGQCGGCHLQHVRYDVQLNLKRQWLQETFRRIAHLEIEPHPLVPSVEWEYRNKITLPILSTEGEIVFAYHQILDPSRFVPIHDCPIAHAAIRKALPLFLQELRTSSPELKEYSAKRDQGSRVQFQWRESGLEARLLNVVISMADAASLAERVMDKNELVSALLVPAEGNKEWKFQKPVAAGPKKFFYCETFRQVNDSVRASLYEYVAGLPFASVRSVLDGYCGIGLMTRLLADRFERVVGVEINPAAVRQAQHLVRPGEEDRLRFIAIPLERFFKQTHQTYSTMVLNPPRSGLSSPVLAAVKHIRPRDVVILSCHPAALARDTAAMVEAGYRIDSLQPFDMFPQTHHLESVIHLKS